ncbi:MAG: hypothetical protein SW833_23995 [Cyanobacteriota bacterium]|nr:hypothetical protein [Cyanobacteriota bacterium]
MSADSKNRKRPYHQPQLKLYGDIKTLTLALSTEDITQDSAGSSGPVNKTF